MACDVGHLQHRLDAYDIHGAVDFQCFPGRYNLLVQLEQVPLTEDKICLCMQQLSAEVLGVGSIGRETLFSTTDPFLQEVIVTWNVNLPLPSVREWHGLRNLQEGMLATEYALTTDSLSMPLKRTMPTEGSLDFLELYSGDFAEWQVAPLCLATVLQEAAIETVTVEHSLPLACAYALSHSAILVHQKRIRCCNWPCPCLEMQWVEWNGVASFLLSSSSRWGLLQISPFLQGTLGSCKTP